MSDQTDNISADSIKYVEEIARRPIPMTLDDDVELVMIPDGYSVKSLENFREIQKRIVQTVELHSEDSFTDYYTRHSTENSALFISTPEKHNFNAIFDYHGPQTPDHCAHHAVYECPTTEDWKIWLGKNRNQMTQKEFAYFIEDNIDSIVDPAGAEMLEIARSLEAKKKVNFVSGTRLDNGDIDFIYQEETQGTAAKGKLKIPEQFHIGLPVFINGETYKVKAKFRYRITEGRLSMWYELHRPDKIIEDAFNAATDRIRKKIRRNVYIGTV